MKRKIDVTKLCKLALDPSIFCLESLITAALHITSSVFLRLIEQWASPAAPPHFNEQHGVWLRPFFLSNLKRFPPFLCLSLPRHDFFFKPLSLVESASNLLNGFFKNAIISGLFCSYLFFGSFLCSWLFLYMFLWLCVVTNSLEAWGIFLTVVLHHCASISLVINILMRICMYTACSTSALP